MASGALDIDFLLLLIFIHVLRHTGTCHRDNNSSTFDWFACIVISSDQNREDW